MTAGESYKTVSLGTVAAGGSLVDYPINSQGTSASVSSPNITSDLGRFLGTGEITTTADFTDISPSLTINNGQSGSVNLSASATASISYYYSYSEVPEPTSLALFGLGSVVILFRRRPIKPATIK